MHAAMRNDIVSAESYSCSGNTIPSNNESNLQNDYLISPISSMFLN